MSENVKLIQGYMDALLSGDFETVSSLLADDLIWHQPGSGVLSGTFKGKAAVLTQLPKFSILSEGTFAIDHVDYIADNGNLVVASLHFKAEARGLNIAMNGVDLFRIEGNKIKEIWLFSEDIQAEDDFWTALSA